MDGAPDPQALGGRLGFSRILVTGADGFVGKHLVPALRSMSHAEFFVTTGLALGAAGAGPSMAFDLLEPAQVEHAIEKIRPDLIVHLAGQASVGLAATTARAAAATWAVNFGGAFAIARAVERLAPDCAVFFVSSAEVYGRSLARGPATEETPVEPISAYARSKAAAEWMLADALPTSSRLITVRPANHTGAGQATNFVAPAFAQQIAQLELVGGGEIRVGNLESERHFLDVRDVVTAYLGLLARAAQLPQRSLFNVASEAPVRVGILLDQLRAASQAAIRIATDPNRMRGDEIPRAEIDTSRLRAETGWRPKYSLDETLRSVLEDCRSRVGAG
jgi:GDP-4-dehydro-6-deoxy-D-mannose reductase